MKRKIHENNIYYTIAWSPLYPYDRHAASRILPEMPGILCLLQKLSHSTLKYLIFYGCWRDGLRFGLKNFFDPYFSKNLNIAREILELNFFYKYAIVDTSPFDMKDIMHYLIMNNKPVYNNEKFKDSKRYENIYVKELYMSKDDVTERIPDVGF